MAFLQNLKDAHSSSRCNQNLSEVFHKGERHPGTANRVTVRASSQKIFPKMLPLMDLEMPLHTLLLSQSCH